MTAISLTNLFNEIADGINVYYNKTKMRFEYHYGEGSRDDSLVLLPYVQEVWDSSWDEFYSLLTKEEYDRAKSYPFRRGYFDYLREIGLYETFKEAEEKAKLKFMEKWLNDNNIVVDANNLDIDCSYL